MLEIAMAEAEHSIERDSGGKSASASIQAFALRVLCSRDLLIALVGVGVLLRVVQYVANRSLWVDEAGLALNLIEKQ